MTGSDLETEEKVRTLIEILDRERADGRNLSDSAVEEIPEIDLRTLLSELIALKSAVRAETSASRDVREKLGDSLRIIEEEQKRNVTLYSQIQENAQSEFEKAHKKAALDLIELGERLDVAIESARLLAKPKKGWFSTKADPAAASHLEGLELTRKKLVRMLDERGIARIKTLKKTFDPQTMEALETTPSDQLDDGTVVEEITAGYLMASRSQKGKTAEILRIAQVIVVRNKENSE